MDLPSLFDRIDTAIAETAQGLEAAEETAAHLNAKLFELRKRMEDLQSQRLALETISREFGEGEDQVPLPPSDAAPNDEWVRLPRLGAVERILQLSPVPMHLDQIGAALRSHGRTGDTYPLISASLATLKRRKGSVVATDRGWWQYVRAGTNAGGFEPAGEVANMDEVVRNSPSFHNVHAGDDAPG